MLEDGKPGSRKEWRSQKGDGKKRELEGEGKLATGGMVYVVGTYKQRRGENLV